MSYLYNVLVTRNLPGSVLTYSYDEKLTIGDIVHVPLQNKIVKGVVLDLNFEPTQDFDESKIKSIVEVFPYRLNSNNLRFLSLFSLNTFNSKNLVLDSLLNPLELLIKKDLQELKDFHKQSPEHIDEVVDNKSKTEIFNVSDIMFRIRYIIRSKLNTVNKPYFTLFVFPERKLLEKTLSNLSCYSEFKKIHILKYFADKSKFSKETVKEICGIGKNIPDSPKIIFSLRAGIFLPIQKLTEINLVDESNSLYIQEQNKVYFDTREAVFLMSQVFNADLNFISTLPSGRLYNFKNQSVLNSDHINSSVEMVKPLKIQISQRNSKVDQFSLFSDFVQQQISLDDTENVIFESEDAN